MGLVYLLLAIVFEVLGTSAMKLAAGLTRPGWTLAVIACWSIALVLLTLALKSIEMSTAYAIWSGLGTVLVFAVGVVLFQESLTPLKLLFVTLIVVGAVGLKLSAMPS